MKNKSIFLLISFHLFSIHSYSQYLSKDIELNLKEKEPEVWHQDLDLCKLELQDFLTISIVLKSENISSQDVDIQIITFENKYQVKPFGEDIQANTFVSEQTFLDIREAKDKISIIIQLGNQFDYTSLSGKINVFSPTYFEKSTDNDPFFPNVNTRKMCQCLELSLVSRAEWGIGFGLTENIYSPPAVLTDVTHLIVHHSAGTNISNNWKGVVASVFNSHVNVNGWQDIGYNYLIDPNGIIYTGRGGGENVKGAHMCGHNENTMGICLLGNFVTVKPSYQAFMSLTKFLANKCCVNDIDPTSASDIASYSGFMSNISGHLDGCAPNYTECPGIKLYEMIENLRNDVSQHIEKQCDPSFIQIETKEDKYFQISPNPVINSLKINTNIDKKALGTLDLYNIRGELIQKILPVDQDIEIKESIESGMYFISNLDKSFHAKFIKM